MNQVIKRIAEGSNYQNLLKRIATFWCFKSSRDLVSGKVSSWGLTRAEDASTAELKFKGGDVPAVDVIIDNYFPDQDELLISTVSTLAHMGDSYSPGASWVLVQRWEDASPRALANIAAIYEANGDFFVVLRVYNECTQGRWRLIAGATSSLAGLQLTLSAVQLRVEPDIQLLALREIGFTPLHKTGAVDGSATFTLLI